MPNIGKYEIESRIGHGGMGDVYRAFDPTLRRKVAIKVLKVGDDAETLNRFRLEATSAGNLAHPNIVTIHDFGEHEGEPFLVMEYLEGQDLQRTIDSGRQFDLVEITEIMSQVADALECAHQHGVIHRDVKPANIMLLNRGGVKLMDFGIARLAGANTQQTKIGHLVGTVLYMSPEQFHNLELDRRVDIWAYGVIYHQLLGGKHPFQVPDQIVTMYNIANKPAPPICSLNPEVPEALGQIVDRCLAKDRDQRYTTMEDLRFDILPVLQDLSKQQAAHMLADARHRMELSDWEGAQAIVRRVLEIEPADRNANALRKTIADAMRKRETGPRIQSLTAAAEQQVAAKEYTRALELFETALKVDPASSSLIARIEEVKELRDRADRAAQILRDATQAFQAGNLTGAHDGVTEALKYEPGHSEGSRLMASIQEEMARRERQQQLKDGLASARNLLRAGSFDQAVKALEDLTHQHPGSLDAAQLLREAQTARDNDRRHRRLRDELAAVQELLRRHNFPEAVQRLEALSPEFPGDEEIPELLRYAREEWKVRQRTEALNRLKESISQLQSAGHYDEAIRTLERAQAEFPNEPDLQRLSQAIAIAKADAERRAALEKVIKETLAKQRSGNLIEALRTADAGLEQFGPDRQLLTLREQLDRDWQAAVKREQRTKAEREALSKADTLEKQNQNDAALAELEAALRLYPDSEPLRQASSQLQRKIADARSTHEREIKLDEARRQAQAEQKRREREAQEAAEAQRRQLEAKVEECLARFYSLVAQNEIGKATKALTEAARLDANHPGIARAQADLAAAKAQPAAPVAPRKSSPIKGVAIGATAALVALAGVYALLHKSPEPAPTPTTTATVAPPTPSVVEKPPVETPPPPPVANPELSVVPGALSFTSESGGNDPAPKSLSISGTGAYQASLRNSQWASISSPSGNLPAQVSIAVHPGRLSAGTYSTQLIVTAGTLQKIATIKLTVSEAPKAPVAPPPTVVTPPPPPPAAVEAKKPTPGIFLGGARLGDLVWSGTLAPGAKVVISPGGVQQGGGSVVRAPIPRDVAFDVSNIPAGVQATASVNSLTLTNTSGAPIQGITIHWAVR